MQVLELPRDVHPYFVATQAHPELTSRPQRPDPMFVGLVRAAMIAKGVAPDTICDASHDTSHDVAATGGTSLNATASST